MTLRSPQFSRSIRAVFLLYLPLTMITTSSIVSQAQAMGKYLHDEQGSTSRCLAESADAKFSGAEARYRIRGSCYVFHSSNIAKDKYTEGNLESTFGNEQLQYIVTWEAQGTYQSSTKMAEETISVLKRVRPDHDNYESIGKLNAKMQCDQDPWRQFPHTGSCALKYFGKDQSLNAYDLNGLYAASAIFPASSNLPPEQRAALSAQYRWYQALFQKPNQSPQLIRPGKAINPTSKIGAVTGSLCNAGFVERLAGPSDYVCVTPESRDRARQENATAASRRNPKGPYGPNTCLTGFVWREAFPGDVVCVTPEIRQLVRQENQMSAGRSTGETSPTQLMRPGSGMQMPGTTLLRSRGIEEDKESAPGTQPSESPRR